MKEVFLKDHFSQYTQIARDFFKLAKESLKRKYSFPKQCIFFGNLMTVLYLFYLLTGSVSLNSLQTLSTLEK